MFKAYSYDETGYTATVELDCLDFEEAVYLLSAFRNDIFITYNDTIVGVAAHVGYGKYVAEAYV